MERRGDGLGLTFRPIYKNVGSPETNLAKHSVLFIDAMPLL